MRFLVDAQLPPALAHWLEQQGYAARHVADVGLAAGNDTEVWALAVEQSATLITKDEDFLTIRNRAGEGPAVVWLRVGNATNRALLTWLAPRFAGVLSALNADETIIEVR